jgi:nucleoside-diphosphate-sugar epimerase
MKVLVTGASGFVGSYLAEVLSNKKYEVYALVRSSSNLRWISDLDINIIYGSLQDKKSLRSAIKDKDYIFHLAGITKANNLDEYNKGNFSGTKNLVDVILEQNIKLKRLIFTSSQAALGPSPSFKPIDETQGPQPLTFYGESKLKAQQYIEEHFDKIPATIVIPSAVYGPRDTDVLEFFKTVKLGIIPHLQGREKYASLIHVKDLADGIISAVESSNSVGQSYFLANPKPYAWSEISRITLDYFGKRAVHVNVPLPLLQGVAFFTEVFSKMTKKPNIVSRQKIIEMKQDFWICTPAKAQRDFKWQAKIEIEDGIKETLSWYVANHWL